MLMSELATTPGNRLVIPVSWTATDSALSAAGAFLASDVMCPASATSGGHAGWCLVQIQVVCVLRRPTFAQIGVDRSDKPDRAPGRPPNKPLGRNDAAPTGNPDGAADRFTLTEGRISRSWMAR